MNNVESFSLNDLPLPALAVENTGVIQQINGLVEHLTGYEATDLLGQRVEVLMPTDSREQHLLQGQVYQKGAGFLSGLRHVYLQTKSGQVFQVNIRVSENASYYLILLYESSPVLENQYNSSLDNAHKVLKGIFEPYWEWDIEQDVMFYSAELMSFLGYKAEAFAGPRTFWEQHIAPEDLKSLNEKIDQHFTGILPNLNATYPLKTKQGELRWVNFVGKILEYKGDQPHRMFGSMKNVTESKVFIDELKKQNDYLSLAENLGNSGHWRLDVAKSVLYWSKGIYRIHGVTPQTYQPTLAQSLGFYIEKEQDMVTGYITQAIEQGKGFHFKSVITQPCGNQVKIECIGDVELNGDGKVTSVFGVSRDITKAEEIFEKMKLLAMVNYTISVPIFFIDDNDNIVYQDISPQHGDKNSVLFNYINFSITEYLALKKQARENGQLKKSNISFDQFNTVFDLSVTYEAEEGIYIWIVENVTEKFRKEQQQIISNRLTILGNTFGNVSHDINNVLGVALGAIEMLEMKFAMGEQNISTYIDRVKNAIDKGKSVTERLLAFTKKPTIRVIDFDPVKDIEDNKYLLKQVLLSTIKLSFDMKHTDCVIKFPQGEFINILLNLVLNAQDAIQENGSSGQISISTNISDDSKFEIHIKDSGVGIERENVSKIFDPFYSKKSLNKGNGIGLANVYNTMYKHNGQIQVEGYSDLGGARFTLIFPCKVKGQGLAALPKSKSLNLKGKSVLVLDDELSIAEFVSLFLENQGAKVTTLSSRPELEVLLSQDRSFDIFITDMILPDLSGREAVEMVKEKHPQVKIYSISGYIALEDRKWEYPVLRKPFNSTDLAEFLLN